jgi:hypothetical protein
MTAGGQGRVRDLQAGAAAVIHIDALLPAMQPLDASACAGAALPCVIGVCGEMPAHRGLTKWKPPF